MTRFLIIIVATTIAADATTAAANTPAKVPSVIDISKVVVTPRVLTYGRHAGRVSVTVELTTKKRVQLAAYTSLVVEMVCLARYGKNRFDRANITDIHKAQIGQPQRNGQRLFAISPLATKPTRCTVSFVLRRKLRRTGVMLKQYCYTGEAKLSPKACRKLRAPIFIGTRPRPSTAGSSPAATLR